MWQRLKMTRKKASLLLTAGILLVVALGSLWYWKKRTAETRTLQIVLIQKAFDDTDFWTSVYQGAETAAEEYNVSLTVMGPENERDIDAQNQMIEEAIESRPDAIVLCPCSTDLTVEYAEAIEKAGIRLVLADSTMKEEVGCAVVATDNYEAGYKLGSYMKQFVTEDSIIGLIAHVEGSSTAVGREAGFRAGLGEANEHVAELVFCDSNSEKAYALTEELLKKYPTMDLIAGLNEYSAVGAARALEDLGRTATIHLGGIDSSVEQIRYLESGVFDALVVQKPFNMGYLSVETAAKAVRGQAFEATQDSGSELITKETMYTEENQKLLFPVGK